MHCCRAPTDESGNVSERPGFGLVAVFSQVLVEAGNYLSPSYEVSNYQATYIVKPLPSILIAVLYEFSPTVRGGSSMSFTAPLCIVHF